MPTMSCIRGEMAIAAPSLRRRVRPPGSYLLNRDTRVLREELVRVRTLVLVRRTAHHLASQPICCHSSAIKREVEISETRQIRLAVIDGVAPQHEERA